MSDSPLKKRLLETAIHEKKDGQKCVSYSQYSIYRGCPYQWSLTYKHALYPFTGNINTVFGTAFHETIQEWLRLLHEVSVKASEEMSFEEYLSDAMMKAYQEEMDKNTGGKHFIPKEELKEYYADGVAILNYIRKKRKILFDNREWELLAIELPLYTPILENNSVLLFNGYIDILFRHRETGIIKEMDFKTSTKGWNDTTKKDAKKIDQILLYKHFLSKQFNVPIDTIEGEFFVVKRKIWQEAQFPQPRHQVIIPAQGKSKVELAVKGLTDFVQDCFEADGTYKEKYHPKKPGSACRFCPYANTEFCDMKKEED